MPRCCIRNELKGLKENLVILKMKYIRTATCLLYPRQVPQIRILGELLNLLTRYSVINTYG